MKIGIDLGTANVLVYVKGKGIVITEPSVVAVSDDNRIVAVGEEAREMIGRTPGNIQAIRRMKDGVIADYVITEAMLRYFIRKAGRSFTKPEVMVCVPSGVTSVEKRAVRDAALKAGAREAYLIEEPLAAAIGANVPISGPSGNMIIDIGGGTSEIAVVALGGIVVSRSLRVGGNRFDEAIASYVRRKYNLMIGERTAEEVKMQIGTALPLERELTMEVRGRDLIAGLPRTIPITSSEAMEAIELGPDERYDWLQVRGFDPVQYIDGVQAPIASVNNTGTDLYGSESVEILKGPVSSLYGQAPPGGIVNMTSRRPEQEFGGELEVQCQPAEVDAPSETQRDDCLGRHLGVADQVASRLLQRRGAGLKFEGHAVQLEVKHGATRVAANFQPAERVLRRRIDLHPGITAETRIAALVALVMGLVQVTVFRRAGVAGPPIMEHRLVNVSQRQVADAFANELQVFTGESAAFPDEIIRPGVQQQDVRVSRLQLLGNLPDLVRRRRSEITGPDKAHAAQLEPAPPTALWRPAFHDRAGGAEARGEHAHVVTHDRDQGQHGDLRVFGGMQRAEQHLGRADQRDQPAEDRAQWAASSGEKRQIDHRHGEEAGLADVVVARAPPQQLPGRGLEQLRDHVEERRLAAARGAEQRDELAGLHAQAERREGPGAVREDFLGVPDLDHRKSLRSQGMTLMSFTNCSV